MATATEEVKPIKLESLHVATFHKRSVWGPMTDLPPAIPRFTRELRQFCEDRGSPRMPPRPRDAHDALVDARHNLLRFRLMTTGSNRASDRE